PMVDDLYGDQYLLVPVEDNKNNPTITNKHEHEGLEGKKYYVLDYAGTFTNVVVGEDEDGNLLTAASITVTMGSGSADVDGKQETYTGAHTEIKWYYPELPRERYSISVNYKTLVELAPPGYEKPEGEQLTYTIGNIVWMNDREKDRIFDSLWGGGSVITFDKQIVTDRGSDDTIADDKLSTEGAGKYEEGRYSVIKKGKNGKGTSVTYRLLFHNTGINEYILSGKNIVDALPNTRGKFKWVLGQNVIYSGVVSKNDATEVHMGDWKLVDSYGEDNLGEEEGTQFITWSEESYVKFEGNGTLAVYITLIFPSNDEEGEATWDLYEEENDGRVLKNTLYVYDFPVSVSHDLESAGRPMLQKGVYRLAQSEASPATSYDRAGTDLKQYSNRDGEFQSVVYYVVLHNDGHSRMYLSDLQDLLPRGFTYVQMVTNSNESNVSAGTVREIQTLGGTYEAQPTILVEMQSEDGTEITYRSATISAGTTKREDGRQQITFSFGAGSGDYPVKYDEELQKYYLDKGEGIVFGYIANVGYADETDDEAWNVIGMPYTDYLEVGLTKQSNTKFKNTHDNYYSAPNDGYRYIELEKVVKEKYGFEAQNEGTSEEEQQWLTSDVRVERGSIVPGITKYTDSYSNNGWAIPSGREEYTASVYGSSTVYWRVKLTNTGSTSLTDYTVRDVMPYPYVFEGTVYYTIKDSQGNVLASHGNMAITEEGYTLITFPEKRTGTEKSISVKNGYTHMGTNVTVNFKEDEWFDLASSGLSDYQIAFAMERVGNAAGQQEEVLKLHFEGGKVAIPAGGEAEIVFASRNPTNSYENTVYINHAELTPNKQSFTDAGQGSIIYGEDGKPETVRAFSPVTVNGAYTTDSVKSIVEKNNPENQANSRDPENNYILLSQPDSVFRYTLTVENNTNEAMQRLVLIDNLPSGTDDHMPFSTTTDRGSEFSVRLSDTPNFEAKITMPVKDPDTGETTTKTYRLAPTQNYSVEYASTTDFGDRQSNDWHGRGGELDPGYSTTAKWLPIDLDELSSFPGEEKKEEEVPELTGTLPKEVVNNAKALRIVVMSARQITLVAGAKLEFSFDAVVEENTEDPASPGEIAWNNFGYHYHLKGSGTDVHLEAMPLVVGVRIPAVPVLEKRLVNAQGIEVKAEQEETFPFLVYEGEKLEGEYKTSEKWKEALKAADRKYHIYELTVPEGASTSGKIKLLVDEEAGWEWKDGATYTMTELSENKDYAFNDFNHFTQTGSENSLTFQYDKDKDDKITFSCYNKLLSWNVEGTKVGDNGATGLEGAVFALYGPTKTLTSVPEDYKDLDIAMTMDVDDTTWYLYDVQTTDGAGNFTWTGLKEDAYYLWEVKAPDRFNFSERNRGMILNRTDTHGGVTYSFKVTNYASFEFPETGGTGRHPFTTVGLSLMAVTALMYLYYHKRRKEGKTS
ncbi:MAG: SpaA isopeptide-forming pilin-related protein, partial [bacterium]|nr:SpaA isopeptide-forming pilin-related protein [bacterium]